MVIENVNSDLSHEPEKLKQANQILELLCRGLVKKLIIDIQTPLESDYGEPLGGMIGHLVGGFVAISKKSCEEGYGHYTELEKLAKDRHYQRKERINKAKHIADHIKIEDLFNFYQNCRDFGLKLAIPIWIDKIKPNKRRTYVIEHVY